MNALNQHALDVLLGLMIENRDQANGNSFGVMKMAREAGSLHSYLQPEREYPLVTRHDSADSMLGDLDCNDNTPVLLPQIDTSTSQPCLHHQDNVMSPSKSCVSTSSSTSHPSLSPEDAANNDFFYDDEFSVQFDATLTGTEEDEAEEEGYTEGPDMLDSVDISTLLSLQQIYPGSSNRSGTLTYRRGLAPSRSDTCLYQLDLDFSSSEKSNNNSLSCDQSLSEHNNYASSSEFSDLKSEPLFTPPPNLDLDHSGVGVDLSTDSLGGRLEDTLSSSFMTDEERYSYDWTAHKDKYMLSFDRSPTKYSDEDMDCHDSDSMNEGVNMVINRHDQVSNQKTGIMDVSCNGSSSVQGTAVINQKIIASDQNFSRNNTTKDMSGETVKKNSGLTTWTKVKQQKEPGVKKDNVGLVTWGAISKKQPTTDNSVTCDIQNEKVNQNHVTIQSSNAINTDSNTKVSVSGKKKQKGEHSGNSTSLYEIFKTVRSHSADEKSDVPQILYSPPSLPHLTTWGAKFGKSNHLGNDADHNTHSDKQLISFASLQNNNTIAGDSGETGTIHLFTGDSFENGGAGTLDPDVSGITLPTSSQSSERRNSHGNLIDLQDADHILSAAKQHSEKKKTSSVMFDNSEVFASENQQQCSHSAKTTVEYMGQSPLISAEKVTKLPQTSDIKSKVPVLNINWNKTEEKRVNFEQQRRAPMDSVKTQKRLSKSVFFKTNALPDLSFLNKNMAQSVTEASQTALLAAQDDHGILEPLLDIPKMRSSKQEPLSVPHSKPVVSAENSQTALMLNKTTSGGTTQSTAVSIPKSGSRSHRTSSSSDNNSFNSSSSSGIDPGSYESLKNKACFTPDLRMQHSEGSSDGGSSETSGESRCQVYKHCCDSLSVNKSTDNRQHHITNSCSENLGSFAKCDSLVKTRSERNRRFKQRSSSCPERSTSNHGNKCNCKLHDNKPQIVEFSSVCDRQGSTTDSESPICAIRHLNMSQSLPKEKMNRKTKPQCHHRECSDLSPSHGHGLVCVVNRVSPAIPRSSHHVNCMCPNEHKFISTVKNEHICCHSVDKKKPTKSVQTNTEKFPLKSCLSKKKSELFRQHCLSAEPELAVMRYSEEGQTRYQLVTYQCPYRASCSSNSDDSTSENQCRRTFEEQVKEKLGKITVQPVYLHNNFTSAWQPCVLCNGCRAPPNSPENNLGDLHCCVHCQQQHHRLSCHSESSHEEESDSDGGRIKKSVKFSENVSYHSPYASPHQSPKKQINVGHSVAQHLLNVKRHNTQDLLSNNKLCIQGMCTHTESLKTLTAHDREDTPPQDFMVSPSSKTPPVIFTENGSVVDISQKRDLVKEVIETSEAILHHFSKTRDPYEKVKLGSSNLCPAITDLVLTQLCPAVYAVLFDGLNQHTRSLFGKVKNSVWRVVEESSELGPSTRVVYDVFREVKGLAYLSTTWMKFNAFLMGILNHRSLDFWLTYVHCNNKLMTRHYQADSLMRLGNGPLNNLFVDMTTALQPLAQLPFRLEYNAEYLLMTRRYTQDEDCLNLPVWKPDAENMNTLSTPSGADTFNQAIDSVVSSATLTTTSTSQHSAEDAEMTNVQSNSSTLSQQCSAKEAVLTEDQMCSIKISSSSLSQVYRPNNLQLVKQAADWTNWAFDTLSSFPVPPISNVTRVLPDQDGLVRKPMQYLHSLVRSVAESTESVIPINTLNHRQSSSVHYGNRVAMQANLSSIDSASQSSQDSSFITGVILKARNSKGTNTNIKPVMVVKDNEILSSDYYEKETDGKNKEEGVFHKIKKQLLEPSAGVEDKIYKMGITNYEFDAEVELPPGGSKSKLAVSRGCSATIGEIESSQKDHKTMDIKKTEPEKNVDSSSSQKQSNKGWKIGPSIINFFDKLLLTDNNSPAQPLVAEVAPAKLQKQISSESRTSSVSSMNCTVASVDEATRQVSEQNSSASKIRRVQTLCHYVASDADQLSFQKGDVMDVVEEINFDWLLCQHKKSQGMVHIACVTEAS